MKQLTFENSAEGYHKKTTSKIEEENTMKKRIVATLLTTVMAVMGIAGS